MVKRYPATGLGAALIPWNEDFTLNEALFRKGLRGMIDGGLKYIYTFGTAGEGFAVDDDMFIHINSIFIEELKAAGAVPIVGCISLSATHMICRLRSAYDLGARDFQISFPSWGALTDAEVDVFFHQVCDSFPDCKFMHYNNGGRSKSFFAQRTMSVLPKRFPTWSQ